MPVESSRTTARKRIQMENGYVDVPVITKINFIDPVQRYQEWQITIDNSAQGDRRVHIETVTQEGNSDNSIEVERIDEWKVSDPVERGQEYQYSFDNRTQNPATPPPYFITHERTHVVRYFGKTNENQSSEDIWIESELIDSFRIVDGVKRGQEAVFTLNNPDNGPDAQADPDDPNIADTGNGIDPPWRTDPFQNIVRINDETGEYYIYYIDFDYGTTWPYPDIGLLAPFGGGSDPTDLRTCGGAVPPLRNGWQDKFYLCVRPRPLSTGWTSSGIPAQADMDLGLPAFCAFNAYPDVAARWNRVDGNPLSTADQGKFPNYDDRLNFSFEEWCMVDDGDTIYEQPSSGLRGKPPMSVQSFGPHSFDLTGATITNGLATDPIVYSILGTQKSLEWGHGGDFIPPANVYTRRGPTEYIGGIPPILPYHQLGPQYWAHAAIPYGECDIRDIWVMYGVPGDKLAEYDTSTAGINKKSYWRIYCLFKAEPSTGTA